MSAALLLLVFETTSFTDSEFHYSIAASFNIKIVHFAGKLYDTPDLKYEIKKEKGNYF